MCAFGIRAVKNSNVADAASLARLGDRRRQGHRVDGVRVDHHRRRAAQSRDRLGVPAQNLHDLSRGGASVLVFPIVYVDTMTPRADDDVNDEDASLRQLVEAHRKKKDEPLHLAVRFFPHRGRKHIHLFEVLGHFGAETISRDRKLFTIAFSSTPQLPLAPGVELRLTLTNPRELSLASREGWASLKPILQSKRDGTANVLASDVKGKELWRMMK